jgi:hypothetical protein
MTNTIHAILTTVDGCKKEVTFKSGPGQPPALLETKIPVPIDLQLDDLMGRPTKRLYSLHTYELLHERQEEDNQWTYAGYREVL